MSKYCVSYDLNENHKDYDGLISAIKDYNCIKALYSTWFVKSDDSAQDIYKHLKPYIDNDDHLFVIEVNPSAKQGWMPKDIWTWLNS